MALDLGAWETQSEYWTPDAVTMPAELPQTPINDGVPDNVVNTPRSDGITFGGILSGVTSTAESLGGVFSKVYNLTSKVEDASFQRTIQKATIDVQRAQALGSLDIQRAAVDANIAIEKARAARQTADAQARIASGAAGYITTAALPVMKLAILGAGVFLAYQFLVKGKK